TATSRRTRMRRTSSMSTAYRTWCKRSFALMRWFVHHRSHGTAPSYVEREHRHVRSRQPRSYSRHPRRPWLRRTHAAPPRRARLERAPRRRPAGRRGRRRGRRRPLRRHRRARRGPVPPHRRRRRPPRVPGEEAAERVSAVSEASARLAAGRAEAAPTTWKVWTNLWIVYIVWGST